MERLIQDLVESLISFDGVQADRLIAEAFAMYPFDDVLLSLIQPSMVEIGERWHHGEINVAAEHFATQFVRRKLSSLLNMFEGDPNRGKIIMACAPDELHDLGALFGALFLMRRGWHVIYLGPQVPLLDLQEAVQTVKPDLVCLAASMPETALQVAEVARAIQNTTPNVLVGYGGRIFNMDKSLRDAIPGTYLGQDGRELVATVSMLLGHNSTSTVEF
jgi:methanogenic corrinoid protein MtbC1